jgi:predicted N-acetyltransferase YhbS
MIRIAPEPADASSRIETLLDRTFGRARFLKTAQRLRDGRLPADGLTFIAHDGAEIVGSIRFWHVSVGASTPALLLGPMAVEPFLQGRGVGAALIRHGLAAATKLGHGAVILVGDAPYYGRFGFRPDLTRAMTLPGPVDRERFLAAELRPGILAPATGLVRPAGPLDANWGSRLRAA